MRVDRYFRNKEKHLRVLYTSVEWNVRSVCVYVKCILCHRSNESNILTIIPGHTHIHTHIYNANVHFDVTTIPLV